jgi:transcriptional regulator with XRE-family HTH domain
VRTKFQDQILIDIGLVIFNRRKKLKVSRIKLALDMGVDEKQIRRIENGQVNCTILSLLKICVLLNIEFNMFENIELNKNIIDF